MAKPDFKPQSSSRPEPGKPPPIKPGADRRNFLVKLAAAGAGALAGIVPLVAGLVMSLDPLRRTVKPPSMRRVAELAEVPEDGQPLAVRVIDDRVDAWNLAKNEPIGLVFVRRAAEPGKVVALNAECPHAGCNVSFAHGESSKGTFKCPCHNSEFELDGKIVQPSPSPRPMDELQCKVIKSPEGVDEVWVEFVSFYPGKEKKVAKV